MTAQPDGLAPTISVEGLNVEFRGEAGIFRAVKDLSFQIHAGETLAVVGESGSGKSGSSLSVMRLVEFGGGRITGGSVRLVGRDGTARDLTQVPLPQMEAIRGNDVAMIFQEPMTSLNPVFTVGEQIAEAVRLHQDCTPAEARAEALRRAVAAVARRIVVSAALGVVVRGRRAAVRPGAPAARAPAAHIAERLCIHARDLGIVSPRHRTTRGSGKRSVADVFAQTHVWPRGLARAAARMAKGARKAKAAARAARAADEGAPAHATDARTGESATPSPTREAPAADAANDDRPTADPHGDAGKPEPAAPAAPDVSAAHTQELEALRTQLDALCTELEDVQRAFAESHSAFAEQLVAMTTQHEEDKQAAVDVAVRAKQEELDEAVRAKQAAVDDAARDKQAALDDAAQAKQAALARAQEAHADAPTAAERDALVAERDEARASLRAATERVAALEAGEAQHAAELTALRTQLAALTSPAAHTPRAESLAEIADALGYRSPDYVRCAH